MAKIWEEKKDIDNVTTAEDLVNLNMKIIQDQNDAEELSNLISIRNNVLNYIGMDNFIDYARDIVDNCKYFSFTSEASRKFIDKNTPIFNLCLVDPFFDEEMSKLNDTTLNADQLRDKFTEDMTKLLLDDIITHITEKLSSTILADKELTEKSNKLTDDIRRLLASNIYSVTVSAPHENKIFLKLIL